MQTDCPDQAVRLVNGSTNREGRVEVCKNGHWGTVCTQSGETAEFASFICSQLGFSKYSKQILYLTAIHSIVCFS